jgi:hypothetical protein
MISKAGDEVVVLSPKGDGASRKTSPKDGNPKGLCVEQLSTELKQLNLQRKLTSSRRSAMILRVGN